MNADELIKKAMKLINNGAGPIGVVDLAADELRSEREVVEIKPLLIESGSKPELAKDAVYKEGNTLSDHQIKRFKLEDEE